MPSKSLRRRRRRYEEAGGQFGGRVVRSRPEIKLTLTGSTRLVIWRDCQM